LLTIEEACMNSFMTSRPARVAAVALTFVLVGGGVATHLEGEKSVWVAALFVFVGVGVGLIGIGWFADDANSTVLALILLPLALLLITPFALYVAHFAHEYGDVLLVAASPLATWGLRPTRRVRALPTGRRLRVV
jgi:hypothetical protein